MPNCRMYGGFMETIGNLWLYVAFFGIVIVMLLINFLGFKQKQGQDVSIKQAAYWSVAWVSVSLIWWWFMALPTTNSWGDLSKPKNHGILCRLLTRKVLAIDNVFVWLMIFAAFSTGCATT